MPRLYNRKTQRGETPADVMQKAASDVAGGKSIRSAAEEYKMNQMTLKRFIVKHALQGQVTSYAAVSKAQKVFNDDMETDLADHVKLLADKFYGISANICRELAYEYAVMNNIIVPENWSRDEKAGHEWFLSFKKRHHLACHKPEATSLARATAFNRYTVSEFYNNLASIMDRYKFTPDMIYNTDESGVTTVQTPKQILTEMGRKQVGSVTSGERGTLVTIVCTINAMGNSILPMFVFPRVKYKDHFIHGAPTGSIGYATKSGWINEDKFLTYLEHIIQHTRCSQDHSILLILDNHESHLSLRVVETAKSNGVVMLTLPPYTSHRLQPLDKTV